MKKVLVLCTGNACRSQMAEGYLRFFANEDVKVYSAGLHPHEVHPRAIEVMKEDNIDISTAVSKDVSTFSGEHFDAIITVCSAAEEKRPEELTAETFFHYDIPDPEQFASDDASLIAENFVQIREEVKKCMLRFVGKYLQPATTASSE